MKDLLLSDRPQTVAQSNNQCPCRGYRRLREVHCTIKICTAQERWSTKRRKGCKWTHVFRKFGYTCRVSRTRILHVVVVLWLGGILSATRFSFCTRAQRRANMRTEGQISSREPEYNSLVFHFTLYHCNGCTTA